MSSEDDNSKTTPFLKDEPEGKRPELDPYRSAGTPSEKKAGAAMFGSFKNAKLRKAPKWAGPLLIGVAAFHVVLFFVMWMKSIWEIEQLDRPKVTSSLAVAPPPPPPPPPPPGGAKPVTPTIIKPKVKVKDIVQPVKIEKQEQKVVEESGDPNGVEGGEEGGEAGGEIGGEIGGVLDSAPPPPPPPPPPAPPQNVPPTLLEGSRIAGEKNIIPDDVTKTEIMRSGKDKVIGSFKLCLDVGGKITSVTQLRSTGFPAYDNKILGKMRGEWKYKPFAVNGRAVPVCTAVTFIYSQK